MLARTFPLLPRWVGHVCWCAIRRDIIGFTSLQWWRRSASDLCYLKRYACHLDLSNRCYQSYPSVGPIVADGADRRHSATEKARLLERSHVWRRSRCLRASASSMGGIRWNCWTREVRHFYGFFTGGPRTESIGLHGAKWCLADADAMEAGVIERSRKPDPDPVAGEPHLRACRH